MTAENTNGGLKPRQPGLVLTRRPGETIELDVAEPSRITIEVLSLRGGDVRIRLAAPKSTKILRGELVNRADAA